MFFFRKKLPALNQLFPDRMDRHAHILWGVDDGAGSPDNSQEIINGLQRMGFKGAWCTPHIMATLPDNIPSALRLRYQEALSTLKLNGFDLRLAAEYMLDESFSSHLESGDLLTWDGSRVLVELPRCSLPFDWEDSLFRIQARGYIPVLAHPERYDSILSARKLDRISRNGVEFQINLSSLAGQRGRHIQKLALAFYQQGQARWVGTDVHCPEHISFWKGASFPH